MRIAFVRGAFLNPWELQSYQTLAKPFSILPIGADWQFYRTPIQIPGISIEKATVAGGSLATFGERGPILYNKATSWLFGVSYGLADLDRFSASCDLLHSAELHSTLTAQCLAIKRRTGVPVVITVWENLPHQGELHPFRRYRKQQASHQVDGILAVTETTKRMLISEGISSDRITVIPMAVDLNHFKPTPKDPQLLAQFGLTPDDFIVLFVGRLESEKGVAELLDTIPTILAQFPSQRIRFCFVGEGSWSQRLLKSGAYLHDSIRVHPFISYAELPKVHNLADVFVLPSKPTPKWQEQFGYVLVESMACGKPIVTTSSGSIPDVVGDAAIMVSPADVAALSSQIVRLIASPEERVLYAQKALGRAQTLYNPKTVSDHISRFYQKVLCSSSADK